MLDEKKLLEDTILIETAGFCMWPLIRNKDKVIVKKVVAEELKSGDIILYKDDCSPRLVCHRFVKRVKSENGFMLFAKSNSMFSCDSFNESNLRGRVVAIMREGKVIILKNKYYIVINWFIAKIYAFYRALRRIV